MKNSRIGRIVPGSNTTMETEVPAMLASRYAGSPDGHFTSHPARMHMMHVTPEKLKNMDVVDDCCMLKLSNARCDAAACACLVAIMNQGRGYHRISQERLARITEQNNIPMPALSSTGALIDAIHVQGYKKIAIIMPYIKPFTQTVIDYIEDPGVEVTDSISLEISGDLVVGRFDPADLAGHADRLNTGGADVVMLSACIQTPPLSSIQVIGDRLSRPVFSVATPMVHQTLKTLGLKARVPSTGCLLSGTF